MATVYTIGHSTRSLDAFLALLAESAIRCLADVRAYPSSRRWPWFGQSALQTALAAREITYRWLPALGGRRHGPPRPDSPHSAWSSPGFRNYADYMETGAFARGIAELLALANACRTAIMCAEALYWRCHRRLIADALVVRGHRVLHIEGPGRLVEHRLPRFARVVDGRLLYDGARTAER